MNTRLLTERLHRVGFSSTAQQIEAILEDASKHNVPYSEFLDTLLKQEIEVMEQQSLDRRIKKAKLPYMKGYRILISTFNPVLVREGSRRS